MDVLGVGEFMFVGVAVVVGSVEVGDVAVAVG